MCGIAGWISDNENMIDRIDILNKMSRTLCRRGPDENGMFLTPDCAMLHRRLTVIDIDNGKQPMSNDDIVLVYNGELYNADELRTELESCGFNFTSHSDTEVLFNAYLYWKENCVKKLNGIFAFAVYEIKTRKLFTARDPIGVKPFFYYKYNGGFIFGSEIKTLLASNIVKPEIDEQGLMEIFFIGPGRTPSNGVFKNVCELCPGECGIYENGIFTKQKYFKLTASPHLHNEEQTIEYTRFLITDSIKRQLVSDVPICTFLSGGLDSSIISAVASEHFGKIGKTLDTYSVNYTDNQKYFQKSIFQPDSDEEYIEMMINSIKSNHHNVIIDNSDLYYALFDSVNARDVPGMADVDSSLLLFCREVKKNFTVAVSGECADELFGGYPWYHNEDILFDDNFPWSRSQEIRRAVLKKGFLPHGEEYVRSRYEDTVQQTDYLPTDSPINKRMREMFMLNFSWFMQTLLDRKDRCSMYSGLEVRVPFCDYRIVQYAYNMPWELKSLSNREKGIVRKAFEDILPEKVAWRKKSPYPKTHNPIYWKLCCEGIENILNDKSSPINEFVNPAGIRKIISSPDDLISTWYGQLMKAPQILAYLIQVNYFLKNCIF